MRERRPNKRYRMAHETRREQRKRTYDVSSTIWSSILCWAMLEQYHQSVLYMGNRRMKRISRMISFVRNWDQEKWSKIKQIVSTYMYIILIRILQKYPFFIRYILTHNLRNFKDLATDSAKQRKISLKSGYKILESSE